MPRAHIHTIVAITCGRRKIDMEMATCTSTAVLQVTKNIFLVQQCIGTLGKMVATERADCGDRLYTGQIDQERRCLWVATKFRCSRHSRLSACRSFLASSVNAQKICSPIVQQYVTHQLRRVHSPQVQIVEYQHGVERHELNNLSGPEVEPLPERAEATLDSRLDTACLPCCRNGRVAAKLASSKRQPLGYSKFEPVCDRPDAELARSCQADTACGGFDEFVPCHPRRSVKSGSTLGLAIRLATRPRLA